VFDQGAIDMLETILVSIVTAIITALATAALTYIGYWRKVEAELRKEYRSRLNERKWGLYAEFAQGVRQLLFKGSDYRCALEEFKRGQTKICDKLWIVASDEVIKAYQRIGTQTSFAGTFSAMMEVLNEMREDLGYDSTKVNANDLMSVVGVDSPDKLNEAFLFNWRSQFAECGEEQ
jgi:hypothetical protein